MANNRTKLFSAISLGLELGFLIAAPLVLFLALGAYLDKKFNTMPLFVIISVIMSFVAMILELRFLILPFMEKNPVEQLRPASRLRNFLKENLSKMSYRERSRKKNQ